jgi:predicted transcriptional regulator
MMARAKGSGPTEKELDILKVLWAQGPCTVRQVNDEINTHTETGYTTTLKLMQIMMDKGLLVRDDAQFKHVYRPAVSAEKTEKQIMQNVLDRVFSGSAEQLVLRALSAKKISPEELNAIRKALDKLEE